MVDPSIEYWEQYYATRPARERAAVPDDLYKLGIRYKENIDAFVVPKELLESLKQCHQE